MTVSCAAIGRLARINALEADFERLDNAALKAKTQEFKPASRMAKRLTMFLKKPLPRCAKCPPHIGTASHDVQMIGGMVLHDGAISEMKTGEGKTLVATLPCYLNALSGRPVHVVTVNDYLAQRDANWMRVVHEALGLSVGCIVHDMDDEARKRAYAADITYATNNELGFDYLRDNMKYARADMCQRGHGFAIVC